MISLQEAVALLKDADAIEILSHHYPDGDTLGSAAALCRALQLLGKQARCVCADAPGPKYQYLFEGVKPMEFEPRFVVSVDVADSKLLGPIEEKYRDRVNLCIDHHGSHQEYAAKTYVDEKAAATCEIIYEVICGLGVKLDRSIANCIYTGITTDTGCFRYPNATSKTYRVAADMMETGIDAADINRVMFDTKSRARLEMERGVMESIEFFFDGRVAVIEISRAMIEDSGAAEGDLEGLAAIPRQVEGVVIGVTMRERKTGGYKISLRTVPPMNAADICSRFGGGGHRGAAGCTIDGPQAQAREKLVAAIGEYLQTAQL